MFVNQIFSKSKHYRMKLSLLKSPTDVADRRDLSGKGKREENKDYSPHMSLQATETGTAPPAFRGMQWRSSSVAPAVVRLH